MLINLLNSAQHTHIYHFILTQEQKIAGIPWKIVYTCFWITGY